MIRDLNWQEIIGKEVRIYRNLNNGRMSVQCKKDGRWLVAGHVTDCIIEAVTFKISEAGRQRVIRENTKNVHAWGQGKLLVQFDLSKRASIELSYNPYKHETFIDRLTRKPIYSCRYLIVRNNKVWVSSAADETASGHTSQQTSLANLLHLPSLLWTPASWQVA